MAKNPKEGKLLYHITAFDNLDSIFENGLLPRNKINFNIKDVADDEILGCGGFISKYSKCLLCLGQSERSYQYTFILNIC